MKSTIKIGMPIPLTGVYGVEAHDQWRAAMVAIEEFNQSGGWDGRFAELLVRDTLFDYELARKETESLIVNDGADIIVGSLKSEDQICMSQVCDQYKRLFNAISMSDAILYKENRSRFTFHEAINFHMMGGAVGRYSFNRLGNRVAMLNVDADYGRHSERGLLHVGRQIDIDFVSRLYHKQNELDLTPYLREIESSKPMVLVLNSLGNDQVNAVRQCTELGLKEKMRIVVPNFSIALMRSAGPDLYDGIIGSAAYYWKREETSASARRFNDLYRKAHGGTVAGTYGAYAYTGVRTVLEAVRLADSTEGERLIPAMLALRFDYCRGPQFYRRLDHQSVQSLLIIESKARSEMENDQDLFDILDIVEFVKERSFHISREVA